MFHFGQGFAGFSTEMRIILRKMGYAGKLSNPIRHSLAATISSKSVSYFTQLYYAKFEPAKTWRSSLEQLLRQRFSSFQLKFDTQRRYIQNFNFSGGKRIASVFGASVIFGSVCFQPHFAYAMDGHDVLFDVYREELSSASNVDKSSLAFWASLCHQSMRLKPHLYIFKSLYANKVEVQDYKLLCIARVEVGDQKLTLVGILGGWWALPSSRTETEGVFATLRTLLRIKLN